MIGTYGMHYERRSKAIAYQVTVLVYIPNEILLSVIYY
jgi:hypothetical protein